MNALNKAVIDGVPKYADSKRFPNVIGTLEWQRYWEEEMYKIINGIEIKGIWIPGRFYYYMNYKQMSTIKGVVTPDMIDLHLELAYYIEYCKINGRNLICAKGRRKGISEAASTMIVDYGWRFSEGYKAGVAAGNKTYVDDFLAKWRFADSRLPPEFSTKKLTDNDNEIIAGYTIRNDYGDFEDKGTFNTIYARTMHINPNMFKGLYLNDVIAEEIGEFEKFLEFFSATKDCLMSGNKQVGTMTSFGCVCAGTKVWDNYGNFVNIEDLKHENGILGFDVDKGDISKEFISYWQPPAEKMCYRITTHTGRHLECSEDHPILSRIRLDNKNRVHYKKHLRFVEAKDVHISDCVAIAEEVNVWGNRRMFEPRIIGWAVGDGSYGIGKNGCFNIKMASADIEVYDYISSKYVTRVDYKAPTKDGRELKKFRINGVYLRDAFKDAGILGQTKENKHLPNDLHTYCKKDVCEFIGGYFDADGCIYTNDKTKETFLKLTSAHYHLLDEMRFILQKIGVHSNIMYEKPNPNNKLVKSVNGHYNLIIKDRKSIVCFYENIHFEIKRKQDKFKKSIKNLFYNKGTANRKSNAHKGLRFERVISVECIGMKPIYNLTAATTNTYIANGIITHNTGGNVNKGSKDFQKAWHSADALGFEKFLIPATRMFYFGGARESERRLPLDTELYKKYKPYELIGVEDRVAAERWIIERRKKFLEGGNLKSYNEDLQNNPLNEEEIFRKTIVNNFNTNILNKQMHEINILTHPKWTKYKLEWVIDAKTKVAKIPYEVKCVPLKAHEDPDECVWIIDGELPSKSFKNNIVIGIDSYDQNESKESKSLGAALALNRTTKQPVAAIRCRPKRRETFYELCIKLSVLYNAVNNVLIDKANGVIFTHFENAGLWHYLADRPKKFESENSGQTHEKGVALTGFSKPRMVSLMETHIEDYGHLIWFPALINELGNYDQVEIGSDNDLADAYGIALMQDISCEIKPKNMEENVVNNRFELTQFEDDGRGGLRRKGGGGTLKDIQEDSDLMWDMFGPPQ